MTTDHDLDVRLLAARGVRDADLPPLPPAFLDHLRAATPVRVLSRVPGATPPSVLAAEQLVDDAHERRAVLPRRRRPSRAAVLRMGVAVLTAAAAWTTAVLVTGPESAAPPSDAPPSAVLPVEELGLVSFELPAFPLTLPTAPEGSSGPVFGASGDGTTTMSYVSADDRGGVNISVMTEPVSGPLGAGEGVVEETVTVGDRPARLTTQTFYGDDGGAAYLDWERLPGQWVIINAHGRYADGEVLTTMAGELIDGPQAMPVQLHLAPAGYSFDFSKDDGRVVRLGKDGDPTQGLTVRLLFADEAPPADQPAARQAVTVQGQPAELIRTDMGSGGLGGWYLQARLPEGTTFVVEAPGSLTAEQVVQIADQVSYTP
jgi:hypothetical protein